MTTAVFFCAAAIACGLGEMPVLALLFTYATLIRVVHEVEEADGDSPDDCLDF